MLPPPFDALPHRLRSLAAGEALFRQDAPATAMFFVLEGTIVLSRHADGVAVPVHRAGPGESLAEAAPFAAAYHCDAVAEHAARVAAIPADAVRARLASDGAFAAALAARLARQVQEGRRLAELRALRPATARVLAALADGRLQGTVTAFAAEVGLTREATWRALAVLERRGAVRRTGRGRYALR